jgi:2-polyprenyl-3-methyl-5-hydroxy-6-metoxy-1,4-benzoquinol methylase
VLQKSKNQFQNQDRWNKKGLDFIQELKKNPTKYLIDKPNEGITRQDSWLDYNREVGNLKEKSILEIGCGRGEFSVYMAKQGAKVTAVDIGPDLINSAKEVSRINDTNIKFICCCATKIDLTANSFDLVSGMAILHHLSDENIISILKISRKLLKPGAKVIFVEPIENSKTFDFIQNLVPVGRRPSIIQRKKWSKYVECLDERALKTSELIEWGERAGFSKIQVFHRGLTIRLSRIIGKRHIPTLKNIDNFLLKYFPPLSRYCRNATVVYSQINI